MEGRGIMLSTAFIARMMVQNPNSKCERYSSMKRNPGSKYIILALSLSIDYFYVKSHAIGDLFFPRLQSCYDLLSA